jgi:agmatine deiminase
MNRRKFISNVCVAALALPTMECTKWVSNRKWRLPADTHPHERTWLAWPSRTDIWGDGLANVQQDILRLANAISEFEPVALLTPPDLAARLRRAVSHSIEIVSTAVDDLWTRDTGPLFVIDDAGQMAAARLAFNGWGNKQVHDADRNVARRIAEIAGVPLMEVGLIGEGGGLVVDGEGTCLLTRSCWINDNRNPGMTQNDIEQRLAPKLGIEKFIWVEGLRGMDITDGHIDASARFVAPGQVLVEIPPASQPDDPFVRHTQDILATLRATTDARGRSLEIFEVRSPTRVRMPSQDFLAAYCNYYVTNGAVVIADFGDPAADEQARATFQQLFPGRSIVPLNIDWIASAGGGIHCATRAQPIGGVR